MTSVDELFKKPGLPNPNKRKTTEPFPSSRNAKASKHSATDEANGRRRATVEDAADDIDEGGYGPSQSPDDLNEEDYGPEAPEEDDQDDDEGRFFGGGVDKSTSSALDFLDARDDADAEEVVAEKMDKSWLRKTALNFEKKINANAELRAKYEDEPQNFMASEADLDASIKALSILSEHTELYEEFAKLGCAGSLVGLLAHENTDVAIDAIEIISELTDEDAAVEDLQWKALVDGMLEVDLLGLLLSNFHRFDENNESDRAGVYHALSVLENLASRPDTSQKIGEDTKLLQWILSRVQKKESPVGQNKQYAAEVLSILLNSPENSSRFLQLPETDGIDTLLQLLSAYRKRDPASNSSEEEFAENLFDTLTTMMFRKKSKPLFVAAEGVELVLIMLREGKFSGLRALRLLDHAASAAGGASEEAREVCEKIVEAAGLKIIFGMLMKKQDSRSVEHMLGILCALLRSLPGDSPARIRTLAKFVEKDYKKLARIVSFRKEYAARLATTDASIKKQQAGQSEQYVAEMQDEYESQRLEAGLFTLQQIDVILAWLVAEDDGAAKRIAKLLREQDQNLQAVRSTLQAQLGSLGEDDTGEGDASLKEMLSTLVEFLA